MQFFTAVLDCRDSQSQVWDPRFVFTHSIMLQLTKLAEFADSSLKQPQHQDGSNGSSMEDTSESESYLSATSVAKDPKYPQSAILAAEYIACPGDGTLAAMLAITTIRPFRLHSTPQHSLLSSTRDNIISTEILKYTDICIQYNSLAGHSICMMTLMHDDTSHVLMIVIRSV